MNGVGQPVWVTGAGGLIGHALVQTAARYAPRRKVTGLTRALDLTDFERVTREFGSQKPSAVIHCAAMSRSPDCQNHPESARLINVEATKHLAQLAQSIPFIFFSTDLVFDGSHGNYDETAPVNPLSRYSETKVQAEHAVLQNPLHTVVRTSLNSGKSPTGDRGFDEQMHNSWLRGETLNLFTDEFRAPIGAQVTAAAVWELLAQSKTGIYHIAGSERLSRWQIGELLSQQWRELQPKMRPGSIKDWQGAPRPPDTSLNCAKAQAFLSFRLPKWSEWLKTQQLASS